VAEEPLVLHRGLGSPTTCRSCGAAIVFAKPLIGKRGPYEADNNGAWILENGVAKHVGAPTPIEALTSKVQRYTSHFAKCPQAAQWRNRGDD
jgi:hypothetical protein